MPADGTRAAYWPSGDFGTSPFFGQFLRQGNACLCAAHVGALEAEAIAGRAIMRDRFLPSPRTIARGFVPWRLPDAGPNARGPINHRRHPKPFTLADGVGS